MHTMHTSVRPFVTAGIALVGAGMIAVQAPVAPPEVPIPHITDQSVQLAVAPSPIEFYTEVTTHALRNSGEIVSAYLSYPISAAVGFAGLVVVPLSWPVTATIAASAVINGIGATLVAIYDVVDAVLSLNVVNLVNAIIDIPARIADGVFNGGYPMGTFLDAGLLTADSPLAERIPGLVIWPAFVGYLVTGGLFGLSATAPEEVPVVDSAVAADEGEASVVSDDGVSDESPVNTDTEQTEVDAPAEVPTVAEEAVVTVEQDGESPVLPDEVADAGEETEIQADLEADVEADMEADATEDNEVQPDVQDSETQDSETQDSETQDSETQDNDDVEAGASQAAEG